MYENYLLIRAHKLLEFATIDLVICDNMHICFNKLIQDINDSKWITNVVTTINMKFLYKLNSNLNLYVIEPTGDLDKNINCDALYRK